MTAATDGTAPATSCMSAQVVNLGRSFTKEALHRRYRSVDYSVGTRKKPPTWQRIDQESLKINFQN